MATAARCIAHTITNGRYLPDLPKSAVSQILSHGTSGLASLRAPTALSVRIESIRTENAVMVNNRYGLG
jgi:hypothetical protein